MSVPRVADRGRVRDSAFSLAALLRAGCDHSQDLDAVLPPEVIAATRESQLAGRLALAGAWQRGVSVPIAAVLRDLTSTGGASSGGALLGSARLDPQSALRPFSVTADAGARVVDVADGSGAAGVPSITGAPVATWAATEGGNVGTSDAVFGLAQPVPKRVGLQFYVSYRLMKQGGALFDALMRMEIGNAIGRALDGAVLAGSGASGQPQGLATLSGVNAVSGTSLAHAGLLAMRKGAIDGGAREDRLRWIATPAVQETLGARERNAGGGRQLWDDGAVLGRPAHAVAEAAASTLVCGDFSLVTVYVLGPLDIIFDYRTLSTGGKISVVASMYVDLAVFPAAAFSVASSIT